MCIDSRLFLNVLDSLIQVRSAADLLRCVQNEVHQLLPHGAFLCAVRPTASSSRQATSLLGSNIAADYMDAIRRPDGNHLIPTLGNFLATREPQLFRLTSQPCETDSPWLVPFERSGLVDIAAFGVADAACGYATYFSFYQIDGVPEAVQERLLRLLVPHMHCAVLALIQSGNFSTDFSRAAKVQYLLTRREREVLEWVRQGKTNAEIGAILGVAYKTVKNQVQGILIKLRVNNRAQAVALAIERGLIRRETPGVASPRRPAQSAKA